MTSEAYRINFRQRKRRGKKCCFNPQKTDIDIDTGNFPSPLIKIICFVCHFIKLLLFLYLPSFIYHVSASTMPILYPIVGLWNAHSPCLLFTFFWVDYNDDDDDSIQLDICQFDWTATKPKEKRRTETIYNKRLGIFLDFHFHFNAPHISEIKSV